MGKLQRKITRGFQMHDKKTLNKSKRFTNENKEGLALNSDVMALINHLDDILLVKKSARHLKDALYGRFVRDDLDYYKNVFVIWVFSHQTSPGFQNLLNFVTWIYLLLTFVEPSEYHLKQFDIYEDSLFQYTFIVEAIVIALYTYDFLLELIHFQSLYRYRLNRRDRKTCLGMFFTLMFYEELDYSLRFFSNVIIITDFVFCWVYYPYNIFRFARLLRPIKLIGYSKQLNKATRSFFGALPKIFDIFLFFVLISLVMAFLGLQIFEEIPVTEELRANFKDHTSFIQITIMVYVLITFDNWPAMAKPMLAESPYYLIYFLPFVIANALFFFPIPIAVIFDSFRKNRGQRIISDKLFTKHALYVSFKFLDWDDDDFITCREWEMLLKTAFGPRVREDCIVPSYVKMAGSEFSKLSCDRFTEFVDIYHSNKGMIVVDPWEFFFWKFFKLFMRKYLRLDYIAKNMCFELLMFLLIIINSIMLIYSIYFASETTANLIEQIDKLFLIVYIIEFFIKLIGLGIDIYFKDTWNKFDFSLIIMSILTIVLFDYMAILKNLRGVKIVKLTRIQKALKMLKALKCIRSFRFVMGILQSFYRMKDLIENIFISLPSVWRTFTLILLFNYEFSIIGMEIFRTENIIESSPPFGIGDYSDFKNSMLELAHIFIANSWSDLMLSYCRRFGSLGIGAFYFISYHAITNIILKSLISGLVWEVFSYMRSQKDPSFLDLEEIKETNNFEMQSLTKNKISYFDQFRKGESRIILQSQVIKANDDNCFNKLIENKIDVDEIEKNIEEDLIEELERKIHVKIPGINNDFHKEYIDSDEDSEESDNKPSSENFDLKDPIKPEITKFENAPNILSRSVIHNKQEVEKSDIRSRSSQKSPLLSSMIKGKSVRNIILIGEEESLKQGHNKQLLQRPSIREEFAVDENKLKQIVNRGRLLKDSLLKNQRKEKNTRGKMTVIVGQTPKDKNINKIDGLMKAVHDDKKKKMEFDHFLKTLKTKFNDAKTALEILKQFLPKKLMTMLLNCNSSLFFKFYDRHFDNIEDVNNPPKADITSGNVEDINEMFMIKRAMMKGRNDDDLRKTEIKFLEEKYGNIVPDLNRFLTVQNIAQIHQRNRLVGILQRTLTDRNPKIQTFFKTMLTIIYNVNRTLLPKGSYFNFFMRNSRNPEQFMIISSDDVEDITMHTCRMLEFNSEYLSAITMCAEKEETAYYGFDVLNCEQQHLNKYAEHFKTTINEEIERSKMSKTTQKEMRMSKFGKYNLYDNIWQGIMLKNKLKDEEPVRKEIDDLAAKRRESLNYDDFIYNEVVIFCLHHFVGKVEHKNEKKTLFKKLVKKALNKKILNKDEVESQKKKNAMKKAHLPDIEFTEFMKDLGEVISIHSNSFFTFCSKIKVYKSLFS